MCLYLSFSTSYRDVLFAHAFFFQHIRCSVRSFVRSFLTLRVLGVVTKFCISSRYLDMRRSLILRATLIYFLSYSFSLGLCNIVVAGRMNLDTCLKECILFSCKWQWFGKGVEGSRVNYSLRVLISFSHAHPLWVSVTLLELVEWI